MIGKLIVHGRDREECIRRLRRAIRETVVDGIKTTLPLHYWITEQPEFISGDYSIKWLEQKLVEKSGK
jgi:acetyl-CoA carboxylase biotin carboxylase subunit